MTKVLVVQHLVTMADARKILRTFKQKKHATAGYFFDLTDLGITMGAALERLSLEAYSEKVSLLPSCSTWYSNPAYILKVYRDVPTD
jgi:hypothetical protein